MEYIQHSNIERYYVKQTLYLNILEFEWSGGEEAYGSTTMIISPSSILETLFRAEKRVQKFHSTNV